MCIGKVNVSEDKHETNAQQGLQHAYARLRRIAQKLMSGERRGHTLSATDVVNEAMSKLLSAGWSPDKAAQAAASGDEDFGQFVRHAAKAMTEVLIDHARRRNAIKRGGGRAKLNLDDLDDIEATLEGETFDEYWPALDEALEELEKIDARRHSVVVMRFFAGMDNRQIARQLEVDERTVGRDWSAARLWLRNRMQERLS
jgi:RNA polymerase sigma factor (TIGR02999 family)